MQVMIVIYAWQVFRKQCSAKGDKNVRSFAKSDIVAEKKNGMWKHENVWKVIGG